MKLAFKVALLLLGIMTWAAGSAPALAQQTDSSSWQAKLQQALPLLGDRNWILVVDSAYPLQVSPGIEMIETHASMPLVLKTVLHDLDNSIQVTPILHTDAEQPFVPASAAPGITAYRKDLKTILGNRPTQSLPHLEMLQKVSEVARVYRVLVLKTTLTVPYTSVFMQLGCKYWSPTDEQQLRARMKAAGQ